MLAIIIIKERKRNSKKQASDFKTSKLTYGDINPTIIEVYIFYLKSLKLRNKSFSLVTITAVIKFDFD